MVTRCRPAYRFGGLAYGRAPWWALVSVRTMACAGGSSVEPPKTFKFCLDVALISLAGTCSRKGSSVVALRRTVDVCASFDVDEPVASTEFPFCLADGCVCVIIPRISVRKHVRIYLYDTLLLKGDRVPPDPAFR